MPLSWNLIVTPFGLHAFPTPTRTWPGGADVFATSFVCLDLIARTHNTARLEYLKSETAPQKGPTPLHTSLVSFAYTRARDRRKTLRTTAETPPLPEKKLLSLTCALVRSLGRLHWRTDVYFLTPGSHSRSLEGHGAQRTPNRTVSKATHTHTQTYCAVCCSVRTRCALTP